MIQTFTCPNCGAPLDYEGGSELIIECPYCKSSVIVPQELRAPQMQTDEGFEAANLGGLLNDMVRLASPLGEIARLARAGKKIEAVKLYRQTFNVGLQEAKEAVDKIERGEPLTMTNVTVEHLADREPIVMTDVNIEPFAPVQIDWDEYQVKKKPSAGIAATMSTPTAIFTTIVACLILFFLAFYLLAILPLRSHPVYRVGMEWVKNDAAVIERFGSPIKESFLVFGTTSRSGYGGETANLQGFISGPRARGTVFIFGTKDRDGTCSISSITIRVGDEVVLAYGGPELEKRFQLLPTAIGNRLPPTAVPSPSPPE